MAKFTQMLERAAEVGQGIVTPQAKQRLSVKADEISKTGDLKAHTSVCEAAMMNLLRTLYEADTDGLPSNYDAYSGQILIACPWTKTGWKLWGLRDWESDCLRWILLQRLQRTSGIVPLFDYSPVTRRWYVRVDIYPLVENALSWLKHDPLTIGEWRAALSRFQKRRERWRTK